MEYIKCGIYEMRNISDMKYTRCRICELWNGNIDEIDKKTNMQAQYDCSSNRADTE